jgi:hypothetical protein
MKLCPPLALQIMRTAPGDLRIWFATCQFNIDELSTANQLVELAATKILNSKWLGTHKSV